MAGSSGDVTMIEVWFRLRDDERMDSVQVPDSCNISRLKKAIREGCIMTLGHLDARILDIYKSKDAFGKREEGNPERQASW
jgi:hypothetical protein